MNQTSVACMNYPIAAAANMPAKIGEQAVCKSGVFAATEMLLIVFGAKASNNRRVRPRLK